MQIQIPDSISYFLELETALKTHPNWATDALKVWALEALNNSRPVKFKLRDITISLQQEYFHRHVLLALGFPLDGENIKNVHKFGESIDILAHMIIQTIKGDMDMGAEVIQRAIEAALKELEVTALAPLSVTINALSDKDKILKGDWTVISIYSGVSVHICYKGEA